jgi:hypothetical protein
MAVWVSGGPGSSPYPRPTWAWGDRRYCWNAVCRICVGASDGLGWPGWLALENGMSITFSEVYHRRDEL